MGVPRLWLAAAATPFVLAFACTESETWTPEEGERRSLGAELYVVLCDRIAASEMPEDVRGHRSNDICHRDSAPRPDTPPRLAAIAENRVRLVSALDAALTTGPLDDDLGTFLTELLPFYDAPKELLPQVTRGFADVVTRISSDAEGLAAFQRLSARQGYRPLEHAIGLLQAVLKYPRLHEFLVAFLDATGPEGKAHEAYTTLTSALALELATYPKNPPSGAETTLDVTHDLFFSTIENETPVTERFLARRDRRGLVKPLALCSGCMFDDRDGDGQADMDSVLGSLGGPSPFRISGVGVDVTRRDEHGRALAADDTLLYEYADVSKTFAGGLGRELLPLLARDDAGRTLVLDLVDALDVLLGPRVEREARYGNTTLALSARDAKKGVGLDLVRLLSVAGRSPDLGPTLEVVNTLIRDHEPELAALVKGMLDAKALADGSDAAFTHENELWDDLIGWIGLMARTSRAPGQETMLEGLMRALADDRAKHFGDVVSTMLRYRDGLKLDPDDKNALPQGAFVTPVDRSRPDTADNRSVMQRSLHLVSEINGQRGLCNKTVLGIVSACSVMDYDDLGRVFGGAMSEEWELKLGPSIAPLISFLNLFSGGNSLGAIMGIDGLDSHPSPQALVRLLFADNSIVDLMLDPLLVRNAPDASEQYWLKKVYANTIEAWEVPLDFSDGQRVSFWDTFRPLAEAFNRHDYDPLDTGPHASDEHSYYIYMELASTLGRYYGAPGGGHLSDPNGPFYNVQANLRSYEGLIADMLSSDMLAVTPCVGDAALHDRCYVTEQTLSQHPTNLGIFLKLHDVLAALDSITVDDGRDGIDLIAGLVELMLNPHKACDPSGTGLVSPDGTGACDRADAPYPPFALRRTADDTFVTTNLGTRYDGTVQGRSATFQPLIQDKLGRPLIQGGAADVHLDQAKRDAQGNKVAYMPRKYVAPLDALLKTLNDVDGSFAPSVLPGGETRLARWRHARSGLVDRFFATDGTKFENRTARALLLSGLDFLAARLEKHRQDGDLDAWLSGLEGRSEEFARTPLVAASMDLFRASENDPALMRELSDLTAYLFDERTTQASFDTTLYAMLDLVQVLRDDANMVPVLASLSRLLAPNTPEAVANGGALALTDGALQRTTNLLRDILRVDEYASLSSLLENLVSTHATHLEARETPLETLVDVVAEVNRKAPVVDQGKQMRAEDFSAVFEELRGFLLDERSGLERVYDIVQSRSGG